MPRQSDPLLEGRILDAARKLFVKGGEQKLSMRTLARLARTNTPTLYRRFRNRTAILRALMEGYQQELSQVLQPCKSPQEAAQRTLEFALARPREYTLIFSSLFTKFREPRPNVAMMKFRFAEWLGGFPEDHARLVLALWTVVHGTAMLLITRAVPAEYEAELRSVFSASVDLLVNTSTSRR